MAVTAIALDPRVGSAMHTWCDAGRTPCVSRDAVDRAFGAPVGQRFTSGDVKGMPCGIGEVIAEYRHTKPSSSSVITNVRSRPARRAGRHVRAEFVSCAQTPSRSAGPAPRGPQRGSRVGVGQRGRSEAQNLARRRAQLHPDKRDGGPVRALSESCSDLARDTAQKPVVNLDLIDQQNALVIGTQIVVSGWRVLAAHPSHRLVRHR